MSGKQGSSLEFVPIGTKGAGMHEVWRGGELLGHVMPVRKRGLWSGVSSRDVSEELDQTVHIYMPTREKAAEFLAVRIDNERDMA